MNKDLKFICQLDGYNYYLGDVIAKNINWYEASILVSKLGEGWELPSRAVANLAQNKFPEKSESEVGWYWLEEEHSTTTAWYQYSPVGYQSFNTKVYSGGSYVRPVLKVKV